MHHKVKKMLGKTNLKSSVLSALKQTRMRVPLEYQDWVVELIGHENAVECKSLPSAVRHQAKAKSAALKK